MPVSGGGSTHLIPVVTPLKEPRADIEVVIVDQTGARIKQVPNASVDSVEWDLNDVDQATISFPVNQESLVDRLTTPPTVYPRLRKDEIQIWHNQELMFWGPAWRRRITGQDNKCQIICEGVLSYLKQRFVSNSSIDFSTLTEQANIAVGLVEYAQGHGFGNTQPNRELNITYPDIVPTGHSRARLYDRDQHANLLDLLKEFPTLNDGFDWALIPFADGRREFTIYYPSRGSRRANLVVELRRNIGDMTFDEDATKLVNESWFTGATSGAVKLENTYIDGPSAEFYGIAQKFSSDNNEFDVQWLLEEAQHETSLLKTPAMTPEIVGLPTPVKLLGVLEPGDTIPIRIDYGVLQVQTDYRITAIKWEPSGSGSGVGDMVTIDCMAKATAVPGVTPSTQPVPQAMQPSTEWTWKQADLSQLTTRDTNIVTAPSDPTLAVHDTGVYNDAWFPIPPVGYYYNYDFDITMDRDIQIQDGMFAAVQFWAIGGDGAYIGLQANGSYPGRPPSKVAIFSWWSTLGATGPGYAAAFTGEGSGYQTLILYDWVPGRKYRMRVWADHTDGSGNVVWQGAVLDTVTGIESIIGDITTPAAWYTGGENGYLYHMVTYWIEHFYSDAIVDCDDLTLMSARFTDFVADQGSYGKLGVLFQHPHFGGLTRCGNSLIAEETGGYRMQIGTPFKGCDYFSQSFNVSVDEPTKQYIYEVLVSFFNHTGSITVQACTASASPGGNRAFVVYATNPGSTVHASGASSITGNDTALVRVTVDHDWQVGHEYWWRIVYDSSNWTTYRRWKVVINNGTADMLLCYLDFNFFDGLLQDITNRTVFAGTVVATCDELGHVVAYYRLPAMDGVYSTEHESKMLNSSGCKNTIAQDVDSHTVVQTLGYSGQPVVPTMPIFEEEEENMTVIEYGGQMHTFSVNPEGQLIHRYTPSGGPWVREVRSSGNIAGATVAVDTSFGGQLHLLTARPDGTMQHDWFDTSWHSEVVT